MKKRLSFRLWLSVVTLLLIALILFFSRGELVYAWGLLEKIDFGKLVWVLPFIVIGYMATGEMVFSYLRQKGFVKNINPMTLALTGALASTACRSDGRRWRNLSATWWGSWRLPCFWQFQF